MYKVLFLILVFALPGLVQESEVVRLLRLKKTELALKEAQLGYAIAVHSHEKGLISNLEFNKQESAYRRAMIEYQEAILVVVGASEGTITILSATKYRDKIGKILVRVRIAYKAPQLTHLPLVDQSLLPSKFFDEIKDVSISLLADGFIVAEPYQVVIPSIANGEHQKAEFVLLKDVDALEIVIKYSGKIQQTKVILLKDTSKNLVTITSLQPSQEVDLGATASYELLLERFSKEMSLFRLAVRGLSLQIAHEVIDRESGARLTHVSFPEGITSIKLQLKLFLPPNQSNDIVVDQSISFNFLCLSDKKTSRTPPARNSGENRSDEISGSIKLELIPRGIGKLDMRIANLYHQITMGDSLLIDVQLKNSGTRRLDQVRLLTDIPINWRASIEPEYIPSIESERETWVQLRLLPPTDVVVGDYETRLKTEAISYGRRIDGNEQVIRIHVAQRTSILSTVLLAVLLVGLLAFLIVGGIKLANR